GDRDGGDAGGDRDEDPDGDGDRDDRPRPSRDRDGGPDKPPPSEEPDPEPRRVAMRPGSRTSNNDYTRRERGWVQSDTDDARSQPDTDPSASQRMVVVVDGDIDDEADTASFGCRAWVSAGDVGLTVDGEDHYFQVELLRDRDGETEAVSELALERRSYELDAGESTSEDPLTVGPIEVEDPQEGDRYSCVAHYRKL
ncbi:MAG: hypothetical protein M3O86_05010, partial [Actinomycetota bacterium]|nr:hypothetical protein [Actinomycetota bacterium]